MSTRARNHIKGDKSRREEYLEARKIRFDYNGKRRVFGYSLQLHMYVLSAYTESIDTNEPQTLRIRDTKIKTRRMTLDQMQLRTLLGKCMRAYQRGENDRLPVEDDDG